MRNILTFDVEDWFHGFQLPQGDNRLAIGMEQIFDLLGDTRATFLVLGVVAEQHPELVQRIANKGHEIGTHGWCHTPIYHQTPQEFRAELCRSLEVLQAITSHPVKSHRAAFFSITKNSLWALDVLAEAGIEVDTSVFPVWNYRCGIPDAARFPHRIGGLWEFPISTIRIGGVNIPFSGGFYARFWPYALLKRAIQHLNRQGQPAIVYFHPWEFDVQQPRVKNASHPLARTTHYHRLHRTRYVLQGLLRDFEWAPLQDFKPA